MNKRSLPSENESISIDQSTNYIGICLHSKLHHISKEKKETTVIPLYEI